MTALADTELEQSLLGAALTDRRALDQASFLAAEDFAFAEHQAIWTAIEALRQRGEVVNPLSVAARVAETVGDQVGRAYVVKLARAQMGTFGAPHWARLLRDLSAKRRLCGIAKDLTERVESDGDVSAEELAADLIRDVEAVSAKAAPKVRDVREVRMAEADAMGKPLPCYSTGKDCLDAAMAGGLYARRAYGVAARKKAGKTVLAGDISDHLNRAGVKHLYIACEMGSEQIEHRIMARHLGVNALAFLDPRYRNSAAFQQRVASYAITAPNNAIYLDAPGLTFDQLRRELTHAILAHGIKGFVLDYLQLVGGQRKGQSKAEHMDEVSQWIAETCKKRNVFALVLAQINQEGNVRGGEGIRLAFDQVYELKRDEAGNGAWLEMLDSRYTKWSQIGSESEPAFLLETTVGPYFREIATTQEGAAA